MVVLTFQVSKLSSKNCIISKINKITHLAAASVPKTWSSSSVSTNAESHTHTQWRKSRELVSRRLNFLHRSSTNDQTGGAAAPTKTVLRVKQENQGRKKKGIQETQQRQDCSLPEKSPNHATCEPLFQVLNQWVCTLQNNVRTSEVPKRCEIRGKCGKTSRLPKSTYKTREFWPFPPANEKKTQLNHRGAQTDLMLFSCAMRELSNVTDSMLLLLLQGCQNRWFRLDAVFRIKKSLQSW